MTTLLQTYILQESKLKSILTTKKYIPIAFICLHGSDKVFNITQFIDKFELCMSPFPTDDITQILLNSSPPSPPFRLCARLLWMQG